MKPTEAAFLVSILDYTTLQGTDTEDSVRRHCYRIVELKSRHPERTLPAAVCVFPVFVPIAREILKGSGVRVATVAGNFPAGQLPLSLKMKEVEYALEQGAEEIDFVSSRRFILENRYEEFGEEICAAAKLCGPLPLKVILETGELSDEVLIKRAANLAIKAGATFLKTSTGRATVNATPETLKALCETVRDHFLATGRKIGLKPAGGIRTPDQALSLVKIVESICGKDWLNPRLLRIGASTLLEALLPTAISAEKTKPNY